MLSSFTKKLPTHLIYKHIYNHLNSKRFLFKKFTLQGKRSYCSATDYCIILQSWNPPHYVLMKRIPIPPRPLKDTPLLLIEDKEALYQMVYELKREKEIGVDVEHHKMPTEEEYTSLIQISTREKDYIVDPIRLWRKLHILNEVFADGNITKVFHGAGYDAYWLKRDFGLFIVNLFDTYVAAEVLDHKSKRLGDIVQRYTSVTLDKTHQLSDWTQRPLSEDHLNYARKDAHFLLYIYDRVTNELLDVAAGRDVLLLATYSRAVASCLKIYRKPLRKSHDFSVFVNSGSMSENQKA